MKYFAIFLFWIFLPAQSLMAQQGENVTLHTPTGNIQGTLLIPHVKGKIPVALLIPGSGPTDRNGNNPMMKNNALKMLAEALYQNGIASLRYDKRGVGASKVPGFSESNIRFEQYIADARGWVDFLKQNKKFSSIVVIGHSQGSLIGMVVAQDKAVSKFVSLEGAGDPINVVLRRQLQSQPEQVKKPAFAILDSLEAGKQVKNVPAWLYTLFRPSIQPYMISWFRYHPQKEIAKLHKPVLIVQGTTDIQVSLSDAGKLKKADPSAQLLIISGMNHILKDAPADRQENIKTYNEPDLPLNKKLVTELVKFIKE
ncbi:alpha/beta hydrolase [Candidatus Sulfidibacterium hydrothermale]|uniref:alpha/beta hydrolase n=1 Tax=Candidatus Sulfidibacterium hydrothermale TaxID=2875962 RepID=UPI001F0A1909|nr:alpha/beta fold hydrolase [Candidatus Sulfidibacterium hydrothermale]UBM63229.1 alpha/beta hydrolase [Candidatus Sulfidibacterium hydrothermale]